MPPLFVYGLTDPFSPPYACLHSMSGQVVTVLCWSLNFWQSSSGLSGEIEDLNVAFPSAMVSALWLCVTLLGLTLLAGTGASSAAQGAWKHQLFLATAAGTPHAHPHQLSSKEWQSWYLCFRSTEGAYCVSCTSAHSPLTHRLPSPSPPHDPPPLN